MTYPRSGGTSVGVGCLITVIVAVVVFFLCLAVAPYYTTQIWWSVRANLYWILPLVIVLMVVFGAATQFENGDNTTGSGLVFLAVVGFLAAIGFWTIHGYWQASTYVASVKVTTDPVPALDYRSPFNVAEAQSRPDLGDINGETNTTMYLPDRREFTTLVNTRGSFTGYQTLLVQHVGDTGRNSHELCAFGPAADARFGGLFGHSLARQINSQARFVNWADGDVYAYCDGTNHPMVVVPLKAQTGIFVVTERPAGVAVYDGLTGKVSIITDNAQIDRIPGPTYPLSLAAAQRESTSTIGGFNNWWFDRAGWELPDDIHDINSGNTSEWVLATTKDRNPVYASLLTGRGDATAISAISTVDARQASTDLAPVLVHRTNPNWLSPASILNRIHANFGDVFMAQPKAEIFEIAPLDGNRWVATIGLPQDLLYRVTGEGDLVKDACLVRLTGEQIRCGGATNINGAGPGVAIGGAGSTQPAPASGDLRVMTPQQLSDLITRASQELAGRTGGK